MDLNKIVNNKYYVPASQVFCLGAGIALGYLVSQERSKKARELYATMLAVEERVEQEDSQLAFGFTEDSKIVDCYIEEIQMDSISVIIEEPYDDPVNEPEPELEDVSVFPATLPEWDEETELANRTPETPYTITRDEYFEDANGFTQSNLTFYQGDNVLVDEQDVPIYNPAVVVGELTFGKGSGDPNIVYIRNEKFEAEYEVVSDSGHYSVEVLGSELEHSFDGHKPQLRKFRD